NRCGIPARGQGRAGAAPDAPSFGAAPGAVARRIAEDPTATVCLLEAGPVDEGNDQIMRLSRWSELLFTEFDYAVDISGGAEAEGGLRTGFPDKRGEFDFRPAARASLQPAAVAGCSSHNSCIAFVAPDSDMNEYGSAGPLLARRCFIEGLAAPNCLARRRWASLGCISWEAETTRKYFDRVREKIKITPVVENDNALNRAFVQSGINAGFPLVEFNTPRYQRSFNDCVGYLQVNCDGEWRASSSYGYLHPLKELPENLTVRCGVNVTEILLDGNKRARGVDSDRGVFEAREEVVVSCGAFDSPKLLMLSGIGPRWHLREVGIDCRVDLPGVGNHLIDHPEGVISWETTRPVPANVRQKYEAALFANTQNTSRYPDLMLHFGLEAFDMHTTPGGYPRPPVGRGICMTPNVTKPKSEGTLRLRSADPADPVVIDFRYFTDPEGHDEAVLIDGIKLGREIARLEPLSKWISRELAPGPDCRSDRAISEYMGNPSSDRLAVVDPHLRVAGGVEGLRVADASIFPTHT
ncbi:MAG: glucose-methanol-choline oxidoreductase, partial [Olpidium bornovanus]